MPANYYTWCILWLMHLTQHEVALISAIFVCVCLGGMGCIDGGWGTHMNGSKDNTHSDLLFLKTLISISNFCHTKGL